MGVVVLPHALPLVRADAVVGVGLSLLPLFGLYVGRVVVLVGELLLPWPCPSKSFEASEGARVVYPPWVFPYAELVVTEERARVVTPPLRLTLHQVS